MPVTQVPSKNPSGSIETFEASLARSGGKSTRKLIASTACAAIVLFGALNSGLWTRFGDQSEVKGAATDSNRDLWSGAGSIDITVNGFKALKEAPTVVLLGSSLIMHPFWSMDSELGDVGDIFHHHESYRMAHDLGEAGIKKPSVYSLAVFGEMISDAYIYVSDFLKGDKKPSVVVFGIAPRDFSDADLPAPTASFTFKRLVGLKNIGRYASEYMPGWQERGDFVANHTCYLYGKRWRLQHEIVKAFSKVLTKFGIKDQSEAVAEPSAEHAGFLAGGTIEERFAISEKEYKRRYRGIDEKDLSLQMGFFKNILQTCKQRGIDMVVVNMPLSSANRALLPPGFYDRFTSEVSSLVASVPQDKFIDLGKAPEFKDHDYWDTAHLNNFGGHKLLRHIEPVVVKLLSEKQDSSKL